MPTDRPPPLPLLRSFALAAEHLSFKQAAAALHVTPAAVSQQIRALEDQLGVPLFQRLTRALALTEAGLELQAGVREGLARLDAAVAQARTHRPAPGPRATGQPVTTVWLAAPPSLASHWLLRRLPDFEAAHPGWLVRLSASAERVGPRGAPPWHSAQARDCALAISYGPDGRTPAADTSAGTADDASLPRPLLRPDYLPVCTPALAAQIRSPRDLSRQVLIVDETLAGAGRRGQPWGWPQWQRAAHVRLPAGQPMRRFSSAQLAIEAALSGQGVALVAQPWVAPMLADGTLAAPLPQRLPSPYVYTLAVNPALAARAEVRALAAWLRAQAAQ